MQIKIFVVLQFNLDNLCDPGSGMPRAFKTTVPCMIDLELRSVCSGALQLSVVLVMFLFDIHTFSFG